MKARTASAQRVARHYQNHRNPDHGQGDWDDGPTTRGFLEAEDHLESLANSARGPYERYYLQQLADLRAGKLSVSEALLEN